MSQRDYSAAKPLSNNQRLVLSTASKGYWADRENRRQSSEAQKRIWADQEKRQRRTEASKRAQALPEVRKKKSQASKRTWADPENRRRSSEAQKTLWAEQKRKLAEAWRPEDWSDWEKWPPDRKMVGLMLIENRRLLNRQIGEMLDESRLPCPFGNSWERTLTQPG